MDATKDTELLIRIDEKVLWLVQDRNERNREYEAFQKEIWTAIDALRAAIDSLRLSESNAKGFLAGGRALWAIITALPVGVVAYVLGGRLPQ